MVSKYLSTFGSSTECSSTVALTPDTIVLVVRVDVVVAPTKSVLPTTRYLCTGD